MTTESLNLHVSPFGRELERDLWNSRAATADSTPVNGADFTAQFTPNRRIDGFRRNNLDELPEQTVAECVEFQLQHEGIGKEVDMPENKSCSESGYAEPTYDDVRLMVRGALAEHDERR